MIIKKYLSYFIKLSISVALISYLFYKIRGGDVFVILLDIKYRYFLISIPIFFICWIVNSEKWRIILARLGFRENIFNLFKLNLISNFYASILPGGQVTGEVIKFYKITKNQEKKANY